MHIQAITCSMLKVRCCVSPEQEKTVRSLLEEFGVGIDDNAEIAVHEAGLPVPDSDVVVTFKADKAGLLKKLLEELVSGPVPENMIILGKKHNTYEPVELENILFFRADGNYVYSVTADAEYEVKYKLYEIELRLREKNFVRVGKSVIVNILKVREIIPWFGSRLLLRIKDTDQRIEVSRKYLKSFKEYLGM